MKKKLTILMLVMSFVISCLGACGEGGINQSSNSSKNTLTVLNYGMYIEEEMLREFERRTGIEVKYEEYESPEEMYTKYKAGAIDYDVICTSEYIIQKLMIF